MGGWGSGCSNRGGMAESQGAGREVIGEEKQWWWVRPEKVVVVAVGGQGSGGDGGLRGSDSSGRWE